VPGGGHAFALDRRFDCRCAVGCGVTVPRQSIIVAGAGMAGLACALACARAGAHVTVFESLASAPALAAYVDVRPNMLRDLSRLGVAGECVRRGFVYNGLSLVNEAGEEVVRIPTPRLAGDQLPPALGISHDDFLRVLAKQATAVGVEFRRGTHVQQIEPETGKVLTDGGEWAQADLVVLAVGADSPLAMSVFGAPGDSSVRERWLYATIRRPEGLDTPTWMAGRLGRLLLVVPISMSRAALAVRAEAAPTGSSSELARTLRGWGGLARRIASTMDIAMPLVARDVTGALLNAPWYREAVLCIGASAHAIAPPFGQSAALAIEDGVVLGDLVGAGLDRADLLQRFMERRLDRVKRVHALTSRAAQWLSRPDPSADLMALGEQIHSIVAEPA
jgi:2-polyprenyl-6-methoxyphenol hydroxylase-like FAD-dependent oxidoreductase